MSLVGGCGMWKWKWSEGESSVGKERGRASTELGGAHCQMLALRLLWQGVCPWPAFAERRKRGRVGGVRCVKRVACSKARVAL